MATSESTSFDLGNLKAYREGKQLEVKSAKGGLPASLWETYSAFANSEGGIIVLGVREHEDGTFLVEGLKDAEKLKKDFWNLINNRQKVSTNLLTDSMVTVEEIEGKALIVIKVPRAERTTRPVYVGMDPRLGTYRRNGDGDYHCSIEEVSLMLRDASPITEDYRLLTKLDYSVFCQDTIRVYRNLFKLLHEDHLWNQEVDEIFMRRIGAMREDKETGKFHPTAAGLLLFGYEYEILEEFPQYFLDYQEQRIGGIDSRWTDRITSQTGDWSGNVFDFLLKVVPKLQADLKVPFVFNGNQTVSTTPLHKVLREAMVNMLTNADFYGRRGVVVQKNSDGFKFANPGSMRVSLKEAIHDNLSDPRNGIMLKILALVQYGERAGSGLHGIFSVWKKVYHTEPTVEESNGGVDRTTLSLSFGGNQPDIQAMRLLYEESSLLIAGEGTQKTDGGTQKTDGGTQKTDGGTQKTDGGTQKTDEGTQKTDGGTQKTDEGTQKTGAGTQKTGAGTQEKILQLLREAPNMSTTALASHLGTTRDGIRKVMEKLRSEGRLVRVGADRGGRWIVKD